ncbi:MAG TPA: Spy/CpxP family protein refolding chaperone [Trinickia sp.]|uniref:Spy/CpxP family protein refolding chaperone n=1 Tax=Trinickia sp. TaxID=2571163 RepID=UPI002CB5C4A9|nr:Spy/CpxP family protein refolding chaperone [Trinickia sp.]HVW53733.1 Spy/CpxP family protein refolding chaperone [Trinickia sp.]
MKRTTIAILTCALVTGVGLGSSSVFAQASTPAAASAAQPSASSGPAADAHAAKREARVEERIAYLRTQLKITPAQETQWKAFAEVMRANGQNMGRLYRQRMQAEASQSALGNMKQYALLAQAHADDMKQLVDAFEPLYDSMSPEQKKLADTTFRQHEHEHERGRIRDARGSKSGAPAKP